MPLTGFRSTRITGLTGVPPLYIQLTRTDWPPEATETLRYFANTGGAMPRATLDRLRAALPKTKPYLMYGLTEAFRSTYLPPEEVDERTELAAMIRERAGELDLALADPGEAAKRIGEEMRFARG